MQDKSFFVIAHNIRSILNVGSIFRTADAFGVTKLYLTGYTGTPKHPKLSKTALGAENFVAWEYNLSAKRVISKLRRGYPGIIILALENNVKGRKPLVMTKYKSKFPVALLLGEETKGIPKPLLKECDQLLEIPMHGQKESLNVSVAFGIAAYALSLQG
jgi:tRNA G18 (ribose-2'-O)-methylase SpoU